MAVKKDETKKTQESKDLKETLELLNGIEIAVKGVGEILEDGKITFADLNPAIEMLKKHEELAEAIKGSKEIVGELKDLDDAELLVLGKKAFELIKSVREAF